MFDLTWWIAIIKLEYLNYNDIISIFGSPRSPAMVVSELFMWTNVWGRALSQAVAAHFTELPHSYREYFGENFHRKIPENQSGMTEHVCIGASDMIGANI